MGRHAIAPTEIAIVVALRKGRVLVARRTPDQVLGGYWEFPGGKIETGEAADRAAARELEEETGLRLDQPDQLELLGVFTDRTGPPLRFHLFLADEPQGEVKIDRPREWACKAFDDLRQLEMPPANQRMLALLRQRLQPS